MRAILARKRRASKYPDTGESGEAYEAEVEYVLHLSRVRFWLLCAGVGLGLSSLGLTAFVIVFGPFVVGESNVIVKFLELIGICLGSAGLVSILMAKRE